MKRIKINAFLAIAVVFIILWSSVLAGINDVKDATSISVTYSFDKPIIKKVTTGNQAYDQVMLKDAPCSGNPSEPYLPTKGAYILLPQKTRVEEIKVITSEKISLGYGHNVMPVGKPVPWSQIEFAQPPVPDKTIYRSQNPFPGKLFTKIGVQKFRGYNILILALHPIQYVPDTGELYYYPNMAVTMKAVENDNINPLFRGLEKDKIEVMRMVDNPIIADTYIEKITRASSTGTFDLLIITNETLKNAFVELQSYYYDKGLIVVIKTLKEIGINLTKTSAPQEMLREYIREAYCKWSIDYVLIGGDHHIVPAKMLWAEGYDENIRDNPWYHKQTNISSDLYYACLDGPFNYDGDDKWGEPTDGEDGDDVDLSAEVYVGRALARNKEEASNFVNKTLTYMQVDPDDEYLKKVLFAGGDYEDNGERGYGIGRWGGNYLDQLIDRCDEDCYTTVGIPNITFNIHKLYDRNRYENNEEYWNKTEIINIINNDVHIINYVGHSTTATIMKMDLRDVDALINNKSCFVYSQGCDSGAFDNYKYVTEYGPFCIAENFTVKTEYGAFAAIMNARLGFNWKDSTDSDSQRFHRQFWDAVFGENITIISKANQDSKMDNLFLINRSCMRYVYYELNFFGDPTLNFQISKPIGDSPKKPVTPSGPTKGKAGTEYTYETSTIDPDDDKIFYRWDWGDGNFSDWLGPSKSGETVDASHTYAEKGNYNISVIAKDIHGRTSEWSDPLPVSMPKTFSLNIWDILEKINMWFSQIFGRELFPGIFNL